MLFAEGVNRVVSADGENIVGGPCRGESVDEVGAILGDYQGFEFPGLNRKIENSTLGVIQVQVGICLLEVRYQHGDTLAGQQLYPVKIIDITRHLRAARCAGSRPVDVTTQRNGVGYWLGGAYRVIADGLCSGVVGIAVHRLAARGGDASR